MILITLTIYVNLLSQVCQIYKDHVIQTVVTGDGEGLLHASSPPDISRFVLLPEIPDLWHTAPTWTGDCPIMSHHCEVCIM